MEVPSGSRRVLSPRSPGPSYIAFVAELPGANSQGATLPEARTNLREAVELVIQASREMSEKELEGTEVIREPLEISA